MQRSRQSLIVTSHKELFGNTLSITIDACHEYWQKKAIDSLDPEMHSDDDGSLLLLYSWSSSEASSRTSSVAL